MAEEYMNSGKDRLSFETDRCVLIPFDRTDSRELKQLYMNQEVRKYLGGVRSEAEMPQIVEGMLHAWEEHHWVIRKRGAPEFIGLISLDLHHDGSFHEVSYQLLPEWWGNGYGIEAVQAVLDYAFHRLNLPKVVAETQTMNIPSRNLLERAGFREERRVIRFGAEQIIYTIEQE